MRLGGKVVILTGGNGFLGREYAQVLGDAGAKVVTWDISGEVSYLVDITSKMRVESAVEDVLSRFGRIDVLINNAALNPAPNSPESKAQFMPYEQYPLDVWRRELEVGLTGSLICAQAVMPVMMRQRSGSIINIGSHYGLIAPDNQIYPDGMFKSIGYATVKGAIPNFTRALAAYLGPYGVRANCLVPGGVQRGHDQEFLKKYGEKTMLGRMADSHEYNQAILFLASDASSYMTGSLLVIDGGWTAY